MVATLCMLAPVEAPEPQYEGHAWKTQASVEESLNYAKN